MLLSVVVPVRNVAQWLEAALDSVLGQQGTDLQVIAVDNGSEDSSPEILKRYAERDPRLLVIDHPHGGTGGARNVGVQLAEGDLLTFADPDDIVVPGAYAKLAGELVASGSDVAVGHFVRLHPDGSQSALPWTQRVHGRHRGIHLDDLPEIVGDVFVWNKMFRTDFWRGHGLVFPENTRYQDQPTITEAFLRAKAIDVIPDVVYLWRVREDGSSVTQRRGDLRNLHDRVVTKSATWALVQSLASSSVRDTFLTKVMPGDMHHYFAAVPNCGDEYWSTLRGMVLDLWNGGFSATSVLPVQRVLGWLVEQDLRECAATLATHISSSESMLPVGATSDGVGLTLLLEGVCDQPVPEGVRRLHPTEWGWSTRPSKRLTWRGPRRKIEVTVARAGWTGTVDASGDTVTVDLPTPTGTARLTGPATTG